MDYTHLGKTGLEVSRLCLGCMSFGEVSTGERLWALDEERSRPIIKKALDAGINFFDTANVYSKGTSEEITGKLLWSVVKREDIVLATKVHGRMRLGPNGAGQSRKAIMFEIDESLRRLGTEYVDLYQIHRYDPDTPIEETLEALHDVVKAGKVRYIGASSMFAFHFMKMLLTQKMNGWTRFVSMQNHVNLLHREEEREMLPLCREEGIGVIPWSPLARGRLARPWGTDTRRSENDAFAATLYGKGEEASKAIVSAVADLAAKRGVTMAQIALAWLLAKPAITAPIVGATKPEQLDDAVGALDIDLAQDEIAALEAPYLPLNPVGFG
jgi:aryl-alcohol dehydrogenase-like predicted oxidoreductase